MKHFYLLSAVAIACTLSSCSPKGSNAVVKQEYLHKYGVPLAKETWESQGRSGQIVTTRRDGVVVTENFEYGNLHGDTTFSYPHSERIQRVDTYHQGSLIATTENFPSGLPQRKETYLTGGERTITLWYETGVPLLVEIYQNGQLMKGEYYNADHELESEVVNGYGERIRRDPFGNLVSKDVIEDGELITRSTYHPNGEPHEWIPFAAGQIHGQKKIFALGGVPERLEAWVGGIQEGPTVFYQNGQKVAEVTYVNGSREGIEKRFRNGTTVVEEISWKAGKKHGPHKVYIGDNVQTEWFFQNQTVSRNMFNQRSRNS